MSKVYYTETVDRGVVVTWNRGLRKDHDFKDFSMNVSEEGHIHGFRINDTDGDLHDFVDHCYTKELGEKYHLDKDGFKVAQMIIMHSLARTALEHMYD